MHENSSASSDKLLPLKRAIYEVTGDEPSPAKSLRWTTRGLAGIDGERIVLNVVPVGRKLFTTCNEVRSWLNAVTAARMARIQRTQATVESVSDDELRAAGLLGRKDGGAP